MGKAWKLVLALCIMITILPSTSIKADTNALIKVNADQISAKGAKDFPVGNMVDKDHSTYWQSMSSNGEGNSTAEQKESRMSDHNRYIDIKLDKTYDLSKINIFTKVDGSYSNYYIYASVDGTNYDKIVSKTDMNAATSEGDSFNVNKRAAYLRINMAYNSNSFQTNIADIEVYGSAYSSTIKKPEPIKVSDWEDSSWKSEWDKVEGNKDYANTKTIKEASNLVGRVIGDKWKANFKFELRSDLNGEDVYEIEDGGNNTIIIRGNNGVSLASGFNYYLKNFAMVDYNPLYASNTELKKGIVPVGSKIVKTTQYDYRYALNFCTYSYTMAFWNWDQYEGFIDWAAMNGVNLMLDIVGQEEVLRQLLQQYNYTDEEIKDYIAGPGYFAWFYMQNLYSFGGPLPDNWFEQRVELGRKMHDRMQTYGITPVIQGFAGQVPLTFDDKNEGAVLTPLDEWPTFTRPAIVTPYLTDADKAAGKKNYFPEMAEKFYEAQKNVFGDVSNYYAADPFHEGGNTTGLEMGEIYKQVQTEMLNSDKDAVWVMQQWQGNLNNTKLKGLVKPSQALALDLQTDLNPQYGVMENNKVPWVWNMLHNFGGRMGLDGEIETIASKLPNDYQKTNQMVGIGITPEALENSPVVYELLFDMTWTKDPIDYQKWVEKYAERRAGGTNEKLQDAWKTLTQTAYAKKGQYFQGAGETVINATPRDNFSSASTWGHSSILYDKKELETALQLLIDNYDEFSKSDAYRYDLADVSEQVLCNAAIEYHSLMVKAKNAGNSADFKQYSSKFLEIIELSDKILSSNEEFLVGTWIDDARNMLVDADDWTKDLFEFNARALATTWGGQRSTSLNDYSNRKWAGLTKDYYGERWKIWVANRQAELDKTAKDPANVKAESNWFMWGWRWANLKSDDGFDYTTKANTTSLKADAQLVMDTYSVTELEKAGNTTEEKVNIALGKVFTTTSTASEGALKDITDGSTGTAWIANGEGPHVLTLDLEGTYKITDMAIAIKQAATDYPFDYKVEYLDVDGNWQVYSELANSTMKSNTEITKDVTGSKIRLTMKSRDVASYPIHLAEFKAFGTPIETTQLINVAKGKTATATRETLTGKPLSNITDEDVNTFWNSVWSSSESAMYPCDVTVDLKGVAEAEFVDIYLEKAGLPYKFTVGVIDKNGTETIVLDQSTTTDTLSTNYFRIPMNQKEITKVVVHYVGRTGQGSFGAASPALAEVKVLSTKDVTSNEAVNYALNKNASATSTQSGRNASNMVDGDKSSLWVFNGSGYSFWDGSGTADTSKFIYATVNLGKAYQIDQVKMYFENANKYYFFKVYVYPEGSNTKEEVYSANTSNVTNDKTNPQPVVINVNKKITKIEVEYQGKLAGKDGWFDIAELEAYGAAGQDDASGDIIFGNGKITTTTTDTSYANTLDGDKGSYVSGIKDKEIVYNLGGEHYVDYADFTFEKAGLGLKYVVYAEDAAEKRTLVLDRSNTNLILDNATVRVDVKQNASKIIFKHLGNNGKGSSYLADPRLYETEIYSSTPENGAKDATINPTKASAIIDQDKTTGYDASKDEVFTISFKKPTDINMFNIVTDNAVAGKYIIELFDEDKNEWKQVYDGTKNEKLKNEFYVTLKESIFASKARITVKNNTLKIQEFIAYEVDKTGPLNLYIEEILAELDTKSYDGTNGSYSPKAKAKVENLIKEAQEAIKAGMNSATVTKWMTDLKAAMKDFTLNGVVYIQRNELLRELSETDLVIKEAKKLGNSVITTEIQKAYDEAKAVYDNYAVTQNELDTATAKLKTVKETFIASLDVVDQYKIQLALVQKAYDEAIVGSIEGQVTQGSKDALKTVIDKAKKDFETANEAQIKEIIKALSDGLTTFEASRIVVDRAPLLAMIQSVSALRQQDYDIDTWKAMQGELKKAQAVYDKDKVSKEMITNATSSLNKAINSMVKLNRTTLRKVLDKVSSLQEKAYTEASWKKLVEANKKANEAYNSNAMTQKKLDDATKALQKAIDGLVKVTKPTPDDKLTILHKGTNTSVTGNFTSSVTFIRKDLSSKEIQKVLNSLQDKTYAKNIKIEKLMDLYLMKNGKVYTHNGEMTVKLPIPKGLENKKLKVVYISDNGVVEELPTQMKDGYLIFKTSHFSKFAIVSSKSTNGGTTTPNGKPSTPGNTGSNNGTSTTPKTGDTTNTTPLFLLLGIGACGMAVVYGKKRKTKSSKNA